MAETLKITFPLLVTDCSCPGIRAGILHSDGWAAYTSKTTETGAAFFEAVKELLKQSKLTLSDIAGFAFCEGPGSTLGIRINAMAINTWNALQPNPRPIFAFKSLEAAACIARKTQAIAGPLAVFSDFRKNAWNGCVSRTSDEYSPIEIVNKSAIGSWPEQRYFVQQRIHSPGSAPGTIPLDYDLEPLGLAGALGSLLNQCNKPTAFVVEKPEFKRWTPERHR